MHNLKINSPNHVNTVLAITLPFLYPYQNFRREYKHYIKRHKIVFLLLIFPPSRNKGTSSTVLHVSKISQHVESKADIIPCPGKKTPRNFVLGLYSLKNTMFVRYPDWSSFVQQPSELLKTVQRGTFHPGGWGGRGAPPPRGKGSNSRPSSSECRF